VIKKILLSITILFLPQVLLAAEPFLHDLYFGLSNNPEVARLQEFLREQKIFTHPENTGNFFTITLEAVKQFQRAHQIKPSAGYFGPLTRAKANSIISSKAGILPSPTPISSFATSTFYNKISFTMQGRSAKPEDERVEITNHDKKNSIDITGWNIKNIQGNRFEIPLVQNLPGPDSRPTDRLILPPGGKVTISVGTQKSRMDFQENLCTGYFAQYSTFNPPISSSCPRLETKNLSQFSDNCIKLMDQIPSCTMPALSYKDLVKIDSECTNFINQNFSYVGCLKNFRDLPDFYKKHWLIWMQWDQEFFRNTHDTAILLDQFGKVAATKSY